MNINAESKTADKNGLLVGKEYSLADALAYEDTLRCVQCGYCLPVCPTHRTMGTETQSPRGRINLVKMAAEGKVSDLSVLAEPIDLCLGCRACETACPVGVPYGHILEQTRHVLWEKQQKETKQTWRQKAQNWFYRKVFPNARRMQRVGDLLWLYQQTIGRTGHWFTSLPVFPKSMREFARILPKMENPFYRRQISESYTHQTAAITSQSNMAFLFTGCIMDVMFHRINRQTGRLLNRYDWRVAVPHTQSCCGALHAHIGDLDTAKTLACKNIEAFEQSGADILVHTAGGCGGMLFEYGKLLADDPDWSERAKRFSEKVKDISEIAASVPQEVFVKDVPLRATYQSSCHLRYVAGVKDAPVQALQRIPGITYVEMKEMDRCCGSAGIYNVVNYDASMEILDEKMENAANTHAQVLVTSNPGCLLQMKLGIERHGMSEHMQAVHLVELLAQSCDIK
ncbi:(Fe-S)-binding protein [Fodinisporobacter ferrooxydans]|uniref:Glycolate oxidase iron-sulfur subunit n=1 Tax=Fodinisporobacter ferrooxydans TaxID=2901836 RepID=A0ABY4CRX9_9BACL|nr:(Fe-S)-binding protein [Alicyclobacillaceae bacterium MYW30-H2]